MSLCSISECMVGVWLCLYTFLSVCLWGGMSEYMICVCICFCLCVYICICAGVCVEVHLGDVDDYMYASICGCVSIFVSCGGVLFVEHLNG